MDPIKCDQDPDWVVVDGHTASVTKQALEDHGEETSCIFTGKHGIVIDNSIVILVTDYALLYRCCVYGAPMVPHNSVVISNSIVIDNSIMIEPLLYYLLSLIPQLTSVNVYYL